MEHAVPYSILSAVQSWFMMNKSFESPSVDNFGFVSSLGGMLRFSRSVQATFCLDVDIIESELSIIRNAKDKNIPDVREYDHSFLEGDGFTVYSGKLARTRSHQRMATSSGI